MAFDPSENLKSANDLLALVSPGADAERYCRAVANRAYYAAYGLLRCRMAQSDANVFGKSGKHWQLVTALTAQADPHINRLGTRLNRLKMSRERADYEFGGLVTMSVAESCVSTAATAVEKIRLLESAQVERIIAALKSGFRC